MSSCVSFVVLLLIVQTTLTLSLEGHDEPLAEFCWKDSQGRGVGKIVSVCGPTKDKIGLLCYSKCPKGYSRFGFDCHQNCPSGGQWSDQGLFCRKTEYGRGAGYPWKFGDGFSNDGMYKRCESDHGRGNCQQNGAIVYPKCKSGYFNVACCICRPYKPDCPALGFNGNVDLSCAKKLIIGDPRSMDCPSNEDNDAGLCYPKCKAGFNGVGPVCWAYTPGSWVGCGMGAAKSSKICGETIFDQVASIGNFALNLFTFGTGKLADMAHDATKLAELKKQFEQLKKMVKANEKIQDAIYTGQGKFPPYENGKNIQGILQADPTTVTPEDIVRVSSQIVSLIDPSGISDIVGSFTYPKCSKLKF